jgi:hypothetical protein
VHRAGALLLAISALTLGCDSNDDEFTGEEGEVAAVIERYQEAVAAGDTTTICRELVAPSSVHDWGGPERCKRALERAFRAPGNGGVPRPGELEIVSISIEGDSATASYADGGFTEVVRENGRWYLSPVG